MCNLHVSSCVMYMSLKLFNSFIHLSITQIDCIATVSSTPLLLSTAATTFKFYTISIKRLCMWRRSVRGCFQMRIPYKYSKVSDINTASQKITSTRPRRDAYLSVMWNNYAWMHSVHCACDLDLFAKMITHSSLQTFLVHD